MKNSVACYVADVGSIEKGNFCWVSSKNADGSSNDIEELVNSIFSDLKEHKKVALGIECVLFIPVPDELKCLGKARIGEIGKGTESRAFSAAPGACATMTGLPQLAWILRSLREKCEAENIPCRATVNWQELISDRANLFVWEAFVSGKGKPKKKSHGEDARQALDAFQNDVKRGKAPPTHVRAELPFLFAGALILWAGLSEDFELLRYPCIVVRPTEHSQLEGVAL